MAFDCATSARSCDLHVPAAVNIPRLGNYFAAHMPMNGCAQPLKDITCIPTWNLNRLSWPDGSPPSGADIEWAARGSVLRKASVTLTHAIAPMANTLADAGARSNVDHWYEDNINTVLAAAEAVFRAVHDQSPDVKV